VDIWSNYTHSSIWHENTRVFHHLGVMSDSSEFSWRLTDVILVRHVAELLHIIGFFRHPSVLTEMVVYMSLLFENGQCRRSLIEFLFFVSQDLVVVGNSIADVSIIVLLLADLPLEEMLEAGFGAVRADIP